MPPILQSRNATAKATDHAKVNATVIVGAAHATVIEKADDAETGNVVGMAIAALAMVTAVKVTDLETASDLHAKETDLETGSDRHVKVVIAVLVDQFSTHWTETATAFWSLTKLIRPSSCCVVLTVIAMEKFPPTNLVVAGRGRRVDHRETDLHVRVKVVEVRVAHRPNK